MCERKWTTQTTPWSNLYEKKNSNLIYDSTNRSLDEFDIEFSDRLSTGKSTSSSSLSWAEDCEADVTKLVAEEYERMLRVLQRLEPIPSHYDKEEYKLWIKTFPCLSLIDRNSASSTRTLTNTNEDNSSPGFRYTLRHNKPSGFEKFTVIEKPLAVPAKSEKFRRNRSNRNKLPENHDRNILNTTLNPMTLEEELYSFLTISNRPTTRKLHPNNNFNNLGSKEASKDGRFLSLPPLFGSNVMDTHKQANNNNNHRRKTSAYRKIDNTRQILPTLEKDLSTYNEKFRSISAVPREFLHVSKCPSALSINNRELATKKFIQDVMPRQRRRHKDAEKKIIINQFAGFS